MASSVSRLIVKPATSIRNTAPTSEIGIATTGMSTDAERAEEQEDHDDDDQQRLGERRAAPRRSRPGCTRSSRTGCPTFMPAGSCAWMPGIASRTCAITSSELAVGSTQTPMNVAVSPLKRTSCVVVLGAEHDVGDLAEPDDDAVLLLDDELPELLRRAQVGVGDRGSPTPSSPWCGRAPRGSCCAPARRAAPTARCRAPPSGPASARCASRTCGRRGCRRAARR